MKMLKISVVLLILSTTIISCGGKKTDGATSTETTQKKTTDQDYVNAANDMCDCVNKSTNMVSDEFKIAMIEGIKSGKSMEEVMESIAKENSEQLLKDASILMEAGPKIEKCMKSLEKKYENIYSKESETEILNKLIKALEKNKSCEWTYSLMKLGMQAEKK